MLISNGTAESLTLCTLEWCGMQLSCGNGYNNIAFAASYIISSKVSITEGLAASHVLWTSGRCTVHGASVVACRHLQGCCWPATMAA
jgi:hypothetical protein